MKIIKNYIKELTEVVKELIQLIKEITNLVKAVKILFLVSSPFVIWWITENERTVTRLFELLGG